MHFGLWDVFHGKTEKKLLSDIKLSNDATFMKTEKYLGAC